MGSHILKTEFVKPDWASQIGHDSEGLWVEFEQLGKNRRIYLPQWGNEFKHDKAGLYMIS